MYISKFDTNDVNRSTDGEIDEIQIKSATIVGELSRV